MFFKQTIHSKHSIPHFSKVRIASENLTRRIQSGTIREVAANQTSIELAQAADVHCRAYMVETAVTLTEGIHHTVSGSLSTTIRQLVELFAIETCNRYIAELIRVRNLININSL